MSSWKLGNDQKDLSLTRVVLNIKKCSFVRNEVDCFAKNDEETDARSARFAKLGSSTGNWMFQVVVSRENAPVQGNVRINIRKTRSRCRNKSYAAEIESAAGPAPIDDSRWKMGRARYGRMYVCN